jgi:hypothetical protein
MSAHALDFIKREITEYLRHNPQDANELLVSVALGMTQYRQAVQEERKMQTLNSISKLYSILNKKVFNSIDLACILPSLFLTFKNSKITGHSVFDIKILKRYLEGVDRLHRTSYEQYYKYCQWIYSCHGSEVAEWFDNLMYWAIKEKLIPEGFGGGDA